MKTSFKFGLLLMLSFSLMSSMCSDDDDDNSQSNNNAQTIQAVTTQAQSGDWIITYFYDTDQEETNNFTGYTFTFGANNELTATNGTNTYTGSWSVTDSNSNDDSPSDVDFNINFSSPPNFEDLSDDWDIVTHSSTKIELIDVSGGNGGTDYLTFEKQ